MKLTRLRPLLANAAFNANNIQIADHVIHNDKWEIFFELKDSPVESLDEAALLTLSVEDADSLIEKYYNDGLTNGYQYVLNIQHEMKQRNEIQEILAFIKGYVFMAVRVKPIEELLEKAS